MREAEVMRERRRVGEWARFLAWVAAGAAIALGTIVFLILAVLPDLILVAFLWSIRRARRSAWGILTGFGLPLLYVAYIHRDGPGETCARTATSIHCQEHLDPLPWLLFGSLLVLGGVTAQALQSRTHNE